MAVGAAVIVLALGRRAPTARCPSGLLPAGPRCCAPGQHQEDGRCAGTPTACPAGFALHPSRHGLPTGCVAVPRRVRVGPVKAHVQPSGWEVAGAAAVELDLPAFDLDATELTWSAWAACAGGAPPAGAPAPEPGTPVTGVEVDQARACCLARGGRLPTAAEFLAAAAGAAGRRFPWGPTGLVCRRAAFGLATGPCARGAAGPELSGARPDGATPEGALDLAGNAAEWTLEPGGEAAARGGSFRARGAGELTSWAASTPLGPAPDLGFRCAYDVPPGRGDRDRHDAP